MRSFTFH